MAERELPTSVTSWFQLYLDRSDRLFETGAINIECKCFVKYFDLGPSASEKIDAWTDSGEFRFYFSKVYRPEIDACSEPNALAKAFGEDRGFL